jgi:UDP-2,3-diacylglucosamine hydrolase
MAVTLFISDLHLSDSTVATESTLIALLENQPKLDALYILGDFFEYWVGDDDDSAQIRRVCQTLARQAKRGTPIYLMRGNRDFALGEAFAKRDGATLLAADEHVTDLYGIPTALLHGDTLCTDDTEYQLIRAVVRDPAWITDMLAKPLEERRAFAEAMRQASKTKAENDPSNIIDVNNDAVEATFQRLGVTQLIHGHTHRPQQHTHSGGKRWVLGDWTPEQGAVIGVATADGFSLKSLPVA